jgi:hypothetical protein
MNPMLITPNEFVVGIVLILGIVAFIAEFFQSKAQNKKNLEEAEYQEWLKKRGLGMKKEL